MLETRTEVEQYLLLQKKSEQELRVVCGEMDLKTEGTKEQLIDQLASLETKQQRSILVPQAIPLRTRDENMQPLDAAIETMRHWRKMIFTAKNNVKQFKLLSREGKPYTTDLPYIKCSTETLKKIIEKGWILPLDYNRDLIGLLKTEPDRFIANIIQKPDSKGKSWLMLHLTPLAA